MSINQSGWKELKLRYLVDINPSKKEIQHLSNKMKVSFVPMESVSESGSIDLTQTRLLEQVESGYTYFKNGDILLAKITPCFENGKIALASNLTNKIGFGSTEFHVLRANENVFNKFIYYVFRSHPFKEIGSAMMTGAAGQKRVPEDYILEYRQLTPPLEEQQKIASFLDKETSKIDKLIEKKQRLIELLQEKRQALITNAITKGLDPSVPMKDSGIPWLGEVPEHWDLKKLKYITRMVGGSTPSKDNLEFWNGDIPWVSPKDMKVDFIHTSQDYITQLGVINNNLELVPENSTLIVVRSGILKHTLPVAMTKIEVTLNQDMKALIPKSNFLISEYLFWMFKGLAKSVLNNSWKIGATVDSIEIELLENLFFPIPSREEQQTIINYLESRTLKINKLISKLQTQITKLQEYRQALITAAVTGKIDVREKVSL